MPNKKISKPPLHFTGVQAPKISAAKLPQHVAVVMDGNGRWAKAKGLPRTHGHVAGESALMDVVYGAIEVGVPWLSAYAFSTENWKRSPEEVKFLMGFNRDVIRRRRDELNDLGVRIRWVGQPNRLWTSVVNELNDAVKLTSKNTKLNLTMCVNYGGKAEVVDAVKALAQAVQSGEINPERINEKTISRYLYEPKMPDVDLFIRSSGEIRTSNFLMWQSAYAELVFDETLWPDFDRRNLWNALDVYVQRNRRFGKA